MNREQVIGKIEKLLALSTSSNVHEAAVAAAHAQKLMTQYNIEQAELGVERQEAFEFKREEIEDRDKIIPHWRRNLFVAVARANGCVPAFVELHRSVKLIVYGTDNDRASTKYILASLVNVVRGLERVFRLTAPAKPSKQDTTNFKLGAATAIAASLAKLRPETGIVLWDKKSSELLNWLEDNVQFSQSKRGGAEVTNYNAFQQGILEGSRIDVSGRTKGALGS